MDSTPWVFQKDADLSTLSSRDRHVAEQYRRDGFVVLDGQNFCDGLDIDAIWPTLIERFQTHNRVQDAWQTVSAVRDVALHPEILRILRVMYGREPIPFQTLNFLHGTEQATHSDTIHFSTLPHGFMCGVWMAMEDITLRQGPLHYYPGSHELPVLTYEDLGIDAVRPPFDSGNGTIPASYQRYEHAIAGVAQESGLSRTDLAIKRGSALIWSANLLHGGSPRADHALTRKSQVSHYIFEGALPVTPMLSRPGVNEYLVRDVIDIRTNTVRRATALRPDLRLTAMGHNLYHVSNEPHSLLAASVNIARRLRNRSRTLFKGR